MTSLPVPVINFVTSPDGELLVATNPYGGALFMMETRSGRVLKAMDHLGVSPSEVLLLP